MWTRFITAAVLVIAGGLAVPSSSAADARSVLVWEQFAADFSSAHVEIADANGEHARALTDPSAGFYDAEPLLSPDGKRVLVERGLPSGHAQIVIVNVRRGTERVIDTGCDDPCVDDILPTWLPDGRHIAFTRVMGPFDPVTGNAVSALLFSETLHGGHLRRLSEPGIDGAYEDNAARFSPDGRSVVVARLRNADLQIALFRLDLDGRPATQLTDWNLAADDPDYSPALYGPTRGLVVFQTQGGPLGGAFNDLATVPAFCAPLATCTASTRLLTDNAASGTRALTPAWSADGRRIIFLEAAGPDSEPDLWTIKADGTDRRRLTNSPEVELSPDSGPGARRR
jgi:Tol biopolymer transport system component